MKPNDYATYKPATLPDLIGAVGWFLAKWKREESE